MFAYILLLLSIIFYKSIKSSAIFYLIYQNHISVIFSEASCSSFERALVLEAPSILLDTSFNDSIISLVNNVYSFLITLYNIVPI